MEYTIGTPELDAYHWEMQDLPYDCAVVAQQTIIEDFIGRDMSESEAVYVATANGWLQ